MECEILNSDLGNAGAMQLQLVGRRCFTLAGTERGRDGHTVAKVSWALADRERETQGDRGTASVAKELAQLYTLTQEWLDLVLSTGAEQHPGHVGAQAAASLSLRPPLPRPSLSRVLPSQKRYY